MSKPAHHAFVRPLARAGYASRGFIYLIIGALTVFAAFGTGENTGTKDALNTLIAQPFGSVLMWAMIVGLCGYIAWRLIQSLLDTDDHGWTPKGIAVRLGLLASAATYTALAFYALGLLGIGDGRDSDTGEKQNEVLETLGQFFGFDLISLAGAVIFVGVSGAHLWKAFGRKYEKHFRTEDAPMGLVHPVSIIGLTARGIIFMVIAWLFAYRYWTAQQENGDMPSATDALDTIRSLPMGDWMMAALGVGLVCFAFYSLSEAVWRRINVEDADHPAEQSAD